MGLAGKGQLRKNLVAQVNRMIADPRSKAMVTNFIGQWLQWPAEVATVAINPREIMLREGITLSAGRGPGGQAPVVAPAIRTALQQEPDAVFAYIMHEDRSVKEFLASDYVFLNQTLADYYKIPGVTGQTMRKVDLSPGDLRGGVLPWPLPSWSPPTPPGPHR